MTSVLNINFSEQWKCTFGILKPQMMQTVWHDSLQEESFARCRVLTLWPIAFVWQLGPSGKRWMEEAERE